MSGGIAAHPHRAPRGWWLTAAVAAGCGLLTPATALAQTATEPALKAVFLYNFAKFTEWPADALRPGAALVLCVAGDPRVGRALNEVTAGRDIDGHPLTTRSIDKEGPVQSCHLLYVEGVDAKSSTALVARVQDRPVLTISDFDAFAQLGGTANLFVESGKMRFAVNVDAAHRSKLRLSSRLLNLAKIVKDAPNASKR